MDKEDIYSAKLHYPLFTFIRTGTGFWTFICIGNRNKVLSSFSFIPLLRFFISFNLFPPGTFRNKEHTRKNQNYSRDFQ